MTSVQAHSSTKMHAVILLNPAASGGRAFKKWEQIHLSVQSRLGGVKVVMPSRRARVAPLVRTYAKLGHTRFIAAGGDGTVNAVANALMSIPQPNSGASLGAIALGSSNDFHKPARPDQRIANISCKIDFNGAQPRDVGLLRFEDGQGEWHTRYWMLNAGLGLTADANAFFNRPDALLRALKHRSTAIAILYAAIRTMLRFRNETFRIALGAQLPTSVTVTNLAVVKSPHFSGNFCYDSAFDGTSGTFHVHLCEDMSFGATLFTLYRLAQHRFMGLANTKSWPANQLMVSAEAPFPVEFDGEVIHSKRVAFGIAEKRLEVCV